MPRKINLLPGRRQLVPQRRRIQDVPLPAIDLDDVQPQPVKVFAVNLPDALGVFAAVFSHDVPVAAFSCSITS